MKDKKELLRKIPKIDEVLQDERLFFFTESTPRSLIVESVREVIDTLRKDICDGNIDTIHNSEIILDEIILDGIIEKIINKIINKKEKSLRPVINATGVILHTNLGRANLSQRAINSITEIACDYSNLEYDIKKGERGSRYDHVESLITKITGAEAAMAVNNNAAATMLVLASMAKGKEVIVSRGELVEIGGSFRIPEIMEESGAVLKEIGTTNKTKPSDYKKAYNSATGAILKVHTSNYRIVGFTEEASLSELVSIGRELDIPVIYDMGSGLIADLGEYGVDEPTVLEALKTGIDVILFSGDKLLGGPQGGIIAGKKEYIDLMKKHPLARAFRVDKMTLAAMEATFFEYLDIDAAKTAIPVLEMITMPRGVIMKKAECLCDMILKSSQGFTARVISSEDQIGGGAAPTVLLDGYAVAVFWENLAAEKIERMLRKMKIPIIVRVSHNQIYFNVRTIKESEFSLIAEALGNIQVKG